MEYGETGKAVFKAMDAKGLELFDRLRAPIKRVESKDLPMPFFPSQEDYVLPKVSDVVAAVVAIRSP